MKTLLYRATILTMMMKGEEELTAKKMIEVISKTNLHMKIKMVSRQLNQQRLR